MLIRLRDFSQHCHLPVDISIDKKCIFNLEHFVNTPNFTLNNKIKREIAKIKEEIYTKYNTNPYIAFTPTIIEFELCVYDIFIQFIKFVMDDLKLIESKFRNIIINNPSIIHKTQDEFNGLIIYKNNGRSYHCINPNEDPIKMINQIKTELRNSFEIKTKKYHKVLKFD